MAKYFLSQTGLCKKNKRCAAYLTNHQVLPQAAPWQYLVLSHANPPPWFVAHKTSPYTATISHTPLLHIPPLPWRNRLFICPQAHLGSAGSQLQLCPGSVLVIPVIMPGQSCLQQSFIQALRRLVVLYNAYSTPIPVGISTIHLHGLAINSFTGKCLRHLSKRLPLLRAINPMQPYPYFLFLWGQ